MLGRRPLLGCALLTLLVGAASAPAQDKSKAEATLLFLPARVDGGTVVWPGDAPAVKDAPKTDSPAPKAEAPKADAPKAEALKADTPKTLPYSLFTTPLPFP